MDLAIIQARYQATRLPGKVMLPLAGTPLLEHVWRRTVRAFGPERVLIATTGLFANAPLLEWGDRLGARVFAWDGHEDDVLGRLVAAADDVRAPEHTVIVRVTADDPFKDWRLMRAGTWPVEVGCERFYLRFLREAQSWASALQHEHLTYLHQQPPPVLPNGWRWTMDTPQDYAFAQAVYDRLYPTDPLFGYDAMCELMTDPAILALHDAAKAAV